MDPYRDSVPDFCGLAFSPHAAKVQVPDQILVSPLAPLHRAVDRALGDSTALRAVVLVGPARSGKTCAVLPYVRTARRRVVWVDASSEAAACRSLRSQARSLSHAEFGSPLGDVPDAHFQSVLPPAPGEKTAVIAVFDDLCDVDVFDRFAPRQAPGLVVVTTRSHDVADRLRFADGIITVIEVDPMVLELDGRYVAVAGLSRINGASVDSSSAEPDDAAPGDAAKYMALDAKSFALLSVLSFFDPQSIPLAVFRGDGECDDQLAADLAFCRDKSAMKDAVKILAKNSFVVHNTDFDIVSIPKSVLEEFGALLSADQRSSAFAAACTLLRSAFPRERPGMLQLYTLWDRCKLYAPHVRALHRAFQEAGVPATWDLCRLTAEYCRYAYERNDVTATEAACAVNNCALAALPDGPAKSNLQASTFSQWANAAEVAGRADESIQLNLAGYSLRRVEVPVRRDLVASFENNLGNNHESANRFADALEWHHRARDAALRYLTRNGPKKEGDEDVVEGYWSPINRTNTARCLIRLAEEEMEAGGDGADKLREAEAMLKTAIDMFMDENEKDRNYAMVAYAVFNEATLMHLRRQSAEAGERFHEAHKFWFRNRGEEARTHPFNAACMYKIGLCYLDQGNVEEGVKIIEGSRSISELLCEELPAEHARNVFMLWKTTGRGEKEWDEMKKVMVKRTGAKEFDEKEFARQICTYWR